MQTKTVHLSLFICLFLLCPFLMVAQEFPSKNNAIPAEKDPDSSKVIEQSLDTLSRKQTLKDTTINVRNTIRPDSVRTKKEPLTDKVTYKATDYERISRSKKKIFLYNEAEVIYEDIQINAGEIILDYEKNTVFAKGIKDTSGVYTQIPIFKQGLNEVMPDSIKFNFDSEKALIYGSRVEGAGGQEINLKSEISKRVNDSVVFMSNVKITTSKNLDDPEYYFYARKVKFVPGQKLVTGLTNMYIADVPTPIGLPFAFFPLNKQQSVSGFLIPSPGETRQRGYFLQNGGYYFALSDYYNLAITGDYYTNGSYALRADSDYRLRYKFNGRLSFNFEKILASERGLPDFSETNTYNIRWNHTQDQKSSPNSRFSASVNLGSSDFFQQSINQSNTGNFLTNNFSSSVSYSRTFPGKTPVNVTVAATHSQNSQTEVINLTLPSAQVNVDRIFPFAPKSGSKKGIIQNINFNYSLRANNQYVTTDSLFFTSEMFRDGRSSIQQTIPISTNFKVAKYISATLGANYTENTVFRTIDQSFDQENNEVVRDTVNGIASYRTYGTSASLGTTLYGFFNFKKGSKIESIRHVIRPNIAISYTPAFDQFFESYQRTDPNDPTATDLTETVEFSRFEGSLLGAPSNRENASLSLGVSNVIEAKVRDKDTAATEDYKKIALLRNLNFRTSYNITADSLRLSPISVSGAIPIVENKLEINFSASLDIYALNSNNTRINTLNINNGGSLFRITGARANFGYSFSSKDFEKGRDKNTNRTQNQTFAAGGRPDDLFGGGVDITGNSNGLPEDDEDQEEQEIQFYNFKIPWNLRVSYEVSYVNSARQNQIGTHSLVFSGDIELGKRWTVGGSSGYDLANPGFTFTSLQFGRDLESWNLRFNWVPFSTRSSWNFFIGIKGNLLSDIKYDKRRAPDERL
ncbi:putative LPS assembly protein LptD [uncultured Dokdonia sp.]|uniref:putative LPS assembly protein LptD n=1 Tax=uncultured Dokdonia sp. TaxID=575653 RepID=UPI002615D5E3|nr:putative LPS assembly protein LptD [uncultured Dokdonia sp.]